MRTILLSSLILAAVAAALDAADAETFSADTRGFGKIEVTTTVSATAAKSPRSLTVYRAQDAAHAKLCAAKRLADLVGFGDLAVADGAGLPGTVISGGAAGMWLLGVRGAEVHELYAPTRADLIALVGTTEKDLKPVTAHAYPRWLDCFDNAGTGMWVGGGGDDYDIPTDFTYLHDHGLTLCTLAPTESRLVAPGILDTSIFDYHAAMAAKFDLPYRMMLFPASPAWAWNISPLPYVLPAAGYIPNQFMEYQADTIHQSYEPNPAADRLRHDLRQRVAGTLAADANLVGLHGCTEISEAGIAELAAASGTPGMAELWHRYLTDQGLDLAAVSRRHTGDPARYHSWNDVKVPVPVDFLGFDPATCVDLRGTWDAHPDPQRQGNDGQWFLPDHGGDWTTAAHNDVLIQMYGKKYNGDKVELPFWMRRQVKVAADALPGLKFLHIARSRSQSHAPPFFSAWINGKALTLVTRDDDPTWDQCYAIDGNLHAGDNLIVLDTKGSPIPGHIFIGPAAVAKYPHLDPVHNQLWYDAVNFDAALRVRSIEDNLIALRAADPDRPLKLMALNSLLDLSIPLCEKYGAYQHDTGGAAGYWCPMLGNRLSLAHGLPWSCELGNPPNTAAEMQKFISLYVRYGNDAADLVFAVREYTTKPDVAAWIDTNLNLMHCIGKMHQPAPQIAILRSTRDCRLGYQEPWDWDLGRGGLQSVGRNFAYVDTPDLASGMVDAYKVILDDGTVLMTDQDLAGIERYIRAGGIFVAQHHTGRDASDRADAWPIARLSGLAASGTIQGGKLHFSDKQTLFPQLRGHDIEGKGALLDFRGTDRTGTVAGLSAQAADVEVVAEWTAPPEGAGKVAVALRHLGKGMIVTLGSTFWRDAKDAGGAYREGAGSQEVIDEMLTSLGVERESTTGSGDAWAEHWQSKNGVYDLYPVSYMNEGANVPATRDLTVTLRRDEAVTQAIEFSALQHPVVAVTCHDGHLTLPTTTYDRMRTRVFGVPRADRERSGIEWFRAQAATWRALPPIPRDRRPETVGALPTEIGLADGWRMLDAAASDAAEIPPWVAAAPTGKTVRLGAFGTLGLPENAVGRFRLDTPVPASWHGRRIHLIFDAENSFGLFPQARLWINGHPADIQQPIMPSAQSAFSLDAAAAAASGTIALALEVDGSKRDPSQRQSKPNGVTGLFYLQADESPLQSVPLPNPWQAATDFNALAPAATGAEATFVYLQTTFNLPANLPAKGPAKRVFLSAQGPLGCIILNGHLVNTPTWMHRLDISGLVTKDGSANLLRWAPGLPYSEAVEHRTVPQLSLDWMP